MSKWLIPETPALMVAKMLLYAAVFRVLKPVAVIAAFLPGAPLPHGGWHRATVRTSRIWRGYVGRGPGWKQAFQETCPFSVPP